MGKSTQTPVTCSICSHRWTVTASRAARNKTITCSPPCRSEQARRNRLAATGTAETRKATCAHCSAPFTRKPSQLAKYAESYCSRECKQASRIGIAAAIAARRNGQWHPCGTCGEQVWRTPGTLRPRVFCSRQCNGKAVPSGYQRVDRVVLICATCGGRFRILPGHAPRGRRFCSQPCANRASNDLRRGQPGMRWPAERKARVSASLRRRYLAGGDELRLEMSARMRGANNPQWRDGRARKPYEPGFTRGLKAQIIRRDRNRCRVCGAPRGLRTHVVHHIDGGKHNHSPENLILLCHSCHGKAHQRMLRHFIRIK